MKQELQIFENEEFGKVRTLVVEGEPWFLLKDVCFILDIKNSKQAKTRLKSKGVISNDLLTNGGIQKADFINEGNLYKLVFQSRKREAERFVDWVTSEVLPSIRKTGQYGSQVPTNLKDALYLAYQQQVEIERLELENRSKDEALQIQAPKVSYHDKVLQSDGLLKVTDISKDYGMSAVRFNRLLNDLNIQYKQGRTWYLYSRYQDCNYTKTKTSIYEDSEGVEHSAVHTYWTQSGRKFLYEKLKAVGILPVREKGVRIDD